MGNIRMHLIIEGRVQGVWFRDSTRKQAFSLGVSGWVRNMRDGSVETIVEGPGDQVKKLAAWCHHGPPAAAVSRVKEVMEEWQGEYSSFDIVY